MGFISWIKDILGFGEDDFDDIELGFSSESTESLMQSLANVSRKRRTLNMNDKEQRSQYVREYCDMMAVASKDVDAQKVEYQQVTQRLADLEEIDKLPMADRSQVRIRAKKIISIEQEEEGYTRPAKKITETQYREMERMAGEIPQVLEKMKADEEYQMKVRRDLNLLEGEKGAVAYQRKEERSKARSARNVAFVSIFAAVMAAALMFVLNQAMHVRVEMGFTILAGAFAIALTAAFVMYQNAQSGIANANRKLTKAISVQNTVKIKYVNVTNVLDYNYAKYKVMNSYELQYIWDKYKEEKQAREHDTDIAERMEEARRELYQMLKHYHISDPSVWVYQPGVLVYDEEAKDIRKQLIVQRQRLKKGIDFELYNLETAKKELEGLVREYPKYAEEIIAIVGEYEE
ncbi:MAG: hypothetical protein IKQ40_04105 [Lachnospiraceae bacterium]|nr:hypothetical protein [Lachnospiraceae bacterium]